MEPTWRKESLLLILKPSSQLKLVTIQNEPIMLQDQIPYLCKFDPLSLVFFCWSFRARRQRNKQDKRKTVTKTKDERRKRNRSIRKEGRRTTPSFLMAGCFSFFFCAREETQHRRHKLPQGERAHRSTCLSVNKVLGSLSSE